MAFRVLIAELATGIICNPDGSRHVSSGDAPLPAAEFETPAEAESHARHVLATMPGRECGIYDGDRFLTVHRPDMT